MAMDDRTIIAILFHWAIAILLAPLFVGIISKTKAILAAKVGPSLFQPYYDIVKLFQKGVVYSRTTTWIFRVAPVIVLAVMLVLALMIPFGIVKAPIRFAGDIFLIAYLLGMARFFIIAAALDTGYSMEGMGASREAFFSCLAELALFMNFVTLAFKTKSLSLSSMIGADAPVRWEVFGPSLFLVVISLFIVILAENCRIPVDDPDTHLELTMVHEVMILDHSGPDLAYMLYASAMKLFLFMNILVPIITPIYSHDAVVGVIVFLAMLVGIAVTIGIVESSMARLRLNRVGNLLLIAFVLAFFGFVVALWKTI
ncbi:MAG TPA: NADH-quinone oxidoreductase subunit H [Candidatus Omnitrophota bacterium]|nr:NADH-quinone oxidoreductase subunit H [Candidatus Omnitrophota bacterium]HPS20281.1 NADH-quinone oxidoreductase subunit H [Candidatus Omnitrophota bacterium]